MEIICGSYNNMLFGYSLNISEDYDERLSFTNDAHASLVKCLSISSQGLLASAGNDEVVKIFDLIKRKEIGSLMHLNGSITDMSFHGKSHLFTSSETGEIAICDSKSWTVLHILKHKSAVLSFAIHESGKLLLSSCKDRTFQTWNLITGRRAFVTNLKQAAEIVRFSIGGNIFATAYSNIINIFTTEDGKLCGEIASPNRIVSIIFINNEILCAGCDGGLIHFFNVSNCQLLHTITTGTIRIKSIVLTASSHLVSVSSDGFILVHLISAKNGNVVSELRKSIATSHRWLCVAAFDQCIEPKIDESSDKKKTVATLKKKIQKSKQKNSNAKTVILKNNKNLKKNVISKNPENKMLKNTVKKQDAQRNIKRKLKPSDENDDNDVIDDVYVEDDGSCPSNDEESDEEKSYKGQQLKIKRSLQNSSEPVKKKLKRINEKYNDKFNLKVGPEFQRNDNIFRKNNFKKTFNKYGKQETFRTAKDADRNKFNSSKEGSRNKFGKKSGKDFDKRQNKKQKNSIHRINKSRVKRHNSKK